MSDDEAEWERKRVENTLAVIDLQRMYVQDGGPSDEWAAKVLQTAEDLGAPLQASVISGYANLCLLILSAIASAGGGDHSSVLDKMEQAVRRMPGSAQA